MKPFAQQTHYELLEVSTAASDDEIRAAFEKASAVFGEDGLGLYSLVDESQAEDFRQRLKTAIGVLLDAVQRAEYDRLLGLRPQAPRAAEGAPRPKRASSPEIPLAPVPIEAARGREAAAEGAPRPRRASSPELPMAPASLEAARGREAAAEGAPRPRRASSPEIPAAPASLEAARAREAAADGAPRPRRASSPEIPMAPALVDPEEVDLPEQWIEEPRAETPGPGTVREAVRQGGTARPADEVPSPMPAPSEPAGGRPAGRPRFLDIPADTEFNGEVLRRLRETAGQSLAQLADKTRISKSHLENIEADRYAALPVPVYLRGILMSLARELGLDPIRVSKSYLGLLPKKDEPQVDARKGRP
jgi:curved DNA-binding protein CbpA